MTASLLALTIYANFGPSDVFCFAVKIFFAAAVDGFDFAHRIYPKAARLESWCTQYC